MHLVLYNNFSTLRCLFRIHKAKTLAPADKNGTAARSAGFTISVQGAEKNELLQVFVCSAFGPTWWALQMTLSPLYLTTMMIITRSGHASIHMHSSGLHSCGCCISHGKSQCTELSELPDCNSQLCRKKQPRPKEKVIFQIAFCCVVCKAIIKTERKYLNFIIFLLKCTRLCIT